MSEPTLLEQMDRYLAWSENRTGKPLTDSLVRQAHSMIVRMAAVLDGIDDEHENGNDSPDYCGHCFAEYRAVTDVRLPPPGAVVSQTPGRTWAVVHKDDCTWIRSQALLAELRGEKREPSINPLDECPTCHLFVVNCEGH